MTKLSDEEFLNELIKRSEDFADQECRKYAVKEIEKIKAEISELTEYFYIESDVFQILDEHIAELKGE